MSTSVESPPNTSSLTKDESSGDDFVLVSPSNSLEQCTSERSKVLQASRDKASVKNFASESRKEDEILEKLIAVSKENDKLKETMKSNNITLQKYIKDFTVMQENHRTNNESIKREHQRAKEVVKKLRDDNRTLKEELTAAQLQITQEAKREKLVGLERENTFLKNEINLLEQHITSFDKDLKNCELSESTSESWRLLLGSLVSYRFQTGISQRNVEFLASEISGQSPGSESHHNAKINAELETEKEILKVDLEKIRVEKQHAEEKLEELRGEYDMLKTNFGQMKEEKEEIKKFFDEQCQANVKERQDHQELENICQVLQNEVQKQNEELQLIRDKLTKTVEENENLSKALDAENQKQSAESQKLTAAAEGNDDDEHKICKEKYDALHELYFKAEKQVNAMEERENTLCATEKAFEREKKQLEETRTQLAAELDSHSKNFQEKTEQLHLELREAREREKGLQKHLIQLQSEQEREESLQEQVCQLIQENDAMRVKIDKLTELNSRRDTLYEERRKEMVKQLRIKENENSSIIGMLQSELGTAKEDRKKYQDENHFIKVDRDRLVCQNEQLMKEYDELLNSFNGTMEENRMRKSNSSAEIDNYKGQMDEMVVFIASAEEAVAKKDTIISDLKASLERVESSWNEEVPILKEQVKVYEHDFNAEREARGRQQTELLNLQEQNEGLTQANTDLQMELDNIMNNQQMAEMQRRHIPQQVNQSFNPDAFAAGYHLRGRSEADQREWPRQQPSRGPEPPRVQQDQSQPEEPFPCDRCGRNFPHFQELQNHVQHCGNRFQCPVCSNEFPDEDTLEIHVQECIIRNA